MGLTAMTSMRLAYVTEYTDCRGKVRRYFRRKGQKLTPLPGTPGSREFREAYEAALDAAPKIGADKAKPGTVAALVAAYYGSAEFKGLKPITRSTYRNYIEPFRRDHGDKRVAKIERKHVKAIVATAGSTGAANNVLGMLRRLMAHAVDMEMRDDNPTLGIKKLRTKEGGFIAWTDEDVRRFAERHEVGSRARLAMSLLLYTAQRRADVVRMGWQHVAQGRIAVRQSKTDERLRIPVHAELQAVLGATPRENMTFLMTDYGQPFTPAGFGNWFGEMCREAGLGPGYNAHGLRKAAGRRLAEAGCTVKQIQAVTGHRTLSEVARYTADADQVKLADEAIGRMK